MTIKEQTRIDNFKEHYNTIKGNISQVNLELEGILKLTEDSKKALIKADINLLTKTEELDSIVRAGKEVENKSRISEERLEKKSEKVFEDEKKSLLLISKMEDKLKLNKETARLQLSALNERTVDLKRKETSLIKSLVTIEKQIKTGEIQQGKLDKRITDFQVQSKTEEDNYAEVSRKSKKGEEILKKEIQRLEKETEKEKQKAVTAHKSLANREAAATVRERDNAILVARLRVLYRQFLPGKALKL